MRTVREHITLVFTCRLQCMNTGKYVICSRAAVAYISLSLAHACLFRGVGDKTAELIVRGLGEESVLQVLNSEGAEARLRDIKGIGTNKAKDIKRQWDENAGAGRRARAQRMRARSTLPFHLRWPPPGTRPVFHANGRHPHPGVREARTLLIGLGLPEGLASRVAMAHGTATEAVLR